MPIRHSISKLCKVILICSALTATTALSQSQIGDDLNGQAAGDLAGHAVSLSANGSRLAIGSIHNDGNGSDSGSVRVYQWSGSNWNQLGNDIYGEAAGDNAGWSVALSAYGDRLAIGLRYNNGSGADAGSTRVYQWSGTNWQQMGNDINGEAAGDHSGRTLFLSSEGNRLAIGSIYNDGNGIDSGSVRVYQWSGSSWNQLGNDIDGEAAGDRSGHGLSMSADGNILAIGADLNDGNGSESGSVRVYQWSGTNWQQMGNDINGEAVGARAGQGLSISADGSILAVGSTFNQGNGSESGSVRVYQWSGTNWQQMGNDINGEAAGDEFGWSLSLSAGGNRLAVGAWHNDGSGADSGSVRVYQWSGISWQQLGSDINGEAPGDVFGFSVALSADSSRLAVGARANDGNGVDSGHVRVFSLPFMPTQVAFNGLFYDPNNSGHGFDFNVHGTGLTVYYYGHTSYGERLWLISDIYVDVIEFDKPFALSMYEVTNGTFGYPELPATTWGALTITMTGCDSGTAVLDGLDGVISMNFVRLVGLPNIDCGTAFP